MKLGEFFVSLIFKADTLTVRDFITTLGDIPAGAALAAGAIGLIVDKAADATKEFIDLAVAMQNFTSTTGLSAQQLEQWQIAGAQTNITAETITSSIQGLQKAMTAIKMGEGNTRPFSLLGVNIDQDAFSALEQLGENIKRLHVAPAVATDLMSQMGVSPEMLKLLMLSNEELKKRKKLVPGMSREEEETFLKTKQNLVEIQQIMKQFSMEAVMPLVYLFNMLVQGIKSSTTAISVLGAALSGAAMYFFPITAAILGLILVLEDLAVYFQGGKSLTGDAVEGLKKLTDLDFSKLTKALDSLVKMWEKLGGVAKIASIGMLAAPAAVLGAGALPAVAAANLPKMIHQSNIFHINSTAPADEVADSVVDKIDRQTDNAEAQLDNGGH